MSLSRRHFLTLAGSLSAAALGLTACNASARPAEPASSSAAGDVEAGAFPVTIAHKYGETTIQSAPLRVVTVGLKEQDDLLAVGVLPVAATKWFSLGDNNLVGPWAVDALGGQARPEELSDADGIQFEKIAALRPDLIIAIYSGLKQEDYDKLTELAPTVAQSKEHQDYGVPWDVQATMVGRAVGRSARMAARVEAAKKKVTDIAAAHPQFVGKTVMTATPFDGIFVYGRQDPRPRLLTELGFDLPPDLDEIAGSAFGGQLSTERVDLLDTDAIVWFVEGKGQETVERNKAYASMKVHQEGREVFTTPGDQMYEAFSFLTVLSVGYLVDRLAPRLKAAVDGDPATKTTD